MRSSTRTEADRCVCLQMGRTAAKKLPHGADGWMRLDTLRLTEIDVNGVEMAVHVRDLGHRIPTFVTLFPAIAID